MRYKRNGFLTFCFSCIPGAGQMFLGFMRRGVSLMALFFADVFITNYFRISLFGFVLPVIWFYAFFDAMNKNALTAEELNMLPDHFLWMEDDELQWLSARQSRMIFAVVLIVAGVYSVLKMVWDMLEDLFERMPEWLYDSIFYDLPRVVFSLIIIVIGIYLIHSRKPEDENEEE